MLTGTRVGVVLIDLDVEVLHLEGMLLEMEKPPPMGSRVTVSVAFGEKVVELSGEVVRHVERGKGRTGVGVHFGDLDPKAKWALEEHLIEKKIASNPQTPRSVWKQFVSASVARLRCCS